MTVQRRRLGEWPTTITSVPEQQAAETVALPRGFVAFTGHLGLRDDGSDDFSVVLATGPAISAGVFTRSRFAGASVLISRDHLRAGPVRGIVTVAKNSNVATGPGGHRDALALLEIVAKRTGVAPAELLISSTGVIGRRYPMEMFGEALADLDLADFNADATAVAEAMMTTDTVHKVVARETNGVRVVGVAKGVGMIEPDMATMLAYVLTDASVDRSWLDAAWRDAVDDTFNCLSIDTDTSTSDSAVVMASGVVEVTDPDGLRATLREVCLDLTLQLARDGEGAERLIVVTVDEARDADQARRVAKAIVNSPLVKTAIHGRDPNWGRVAMAIGKCRDDEDITPERTVIRFSDLEVYPTEPGDDGLQRLVEIMGGDRVDIHVSLGIGTANSRVYGCDLTADYVRINADYTT
jgi:glutamate N-acetyltransferase/amino-acid N-acetyltransferase